MNVNLILGLAAGLIASISASVLIMNLRSSRRGPNFRGLMGGGDTEALGSVSEMRERLRNDPTGEEYERLKDVTRKNEKKKIKLSIEERFFQAGIFSDQDKREFYRLKIMAPLVTIPLFGGLMYFMVDSLEYAFYGAAAGLLWGLQLPNSVLDRKTQRRGDEILFYLPLVIEQIAIGVSSSLDVGPCLQRVVQMADERDSHNVVTELVRHAQFYIKSGASMEDSLNEVGRLSGNLELKHAFMSLAQVAKHGGEITRQLQELADAVAGQRETKIEAKIKKLELEATGPVAMVFAGFLVILLIGFGIQMKGAFG